MSNPLETDQKDHVYTWLQEPPITPGEQLAKEWLDKFTMPAFEKPTAWLDQHVVTCTWKGEKYVCSGASRLGDVWLRGVNSENYYDHRVNVRELSDWARHEKGKETCYNPKIKAETSGLPQNLCVGRRMLRRFGPPDDKRSNCTLCKRPGCPVWAYGVHMLCGKCLRVSERKFQEDLNKWRKK